MKKKVNFYLVIFLFALTACNKYNPVNDKIYGIPSKNNMLSESSLKSLEDVIKAFPDNPENFYKKALFHLKKNEDTLALASIKKALSLDSLNAKYYYILSKSQHRLRQTDLAMAAINKAGKQEDNNFEILILSGELSYLQKDFDNAIKYLNKALMISTSDARPYYWKANVEIARSDSASAIRNLNLALQKKPDYVDVYNSFAELYNKFEMYKTSVQFADKGLKINPRHDLLNFNKAEAFRRRVYFDDSAKVYYQKAYELNPELYLASYYLGRYAFDRAAFKEATKYFESSLKYKPEFSKSNYYLGICYRYAGKKEDALKKFEKTMKLEPTNLSAREFYWSVKNDIDQEKFLAREDSIRRAYYKMLEEQRKKHEELLKSNQ